jgi:hypothetical protein
MTITELEYSPPQELSPEDQAKSIADSTWVPGTDLPTGAHERIYLEPGVNGAVEGERVIFDDLAEMRALGVVALVDDYPALGHFLLSRVDGATEQHKDTLEDVLVVQDSLLALQVKQVLGTNLAREMFGTSPATSEKLPQPPSKHQKVLRNLKDIARRFLLPPRPA